ncbi:molybdate ABC transporter permease subunit [Calidifontibacter terrae]
MIRGRAGEALGLKAVATLAAALLVFPLIALLSRVSWTHLGRDLTTAGAGQALRLSLMTTTSSTLICALLGTPLAWFLARSEGRAIAVLRAIVTVPLVLPPVVGGVALLMAWGRTGVVGGPLHDWFGFTLPYNAVRVIIAETFVSLPFFVLAVEGALRTVDPSYDELAATLGATPGRRLRTIALPLALPGILSGMTLAWARSLGEFGATITFAGSFPGTTQTGPLAVYQALDVSIDAATALAAVMLLICVAVLALLRGSWLR